MRPSYWQSQTTQQPLFPELEWSKPENRMYAGKLLVIGGNVHEFAVPAEAYNAALTAGIGTARVLLPDALRKIVGPLIPEADFAPSTPNGSFSKKALTELLLGSNWADAILVAGDLGRNSETAITLESFLAKYPGKTILTNDAVDYVTSSPKTALNRSDTLLVLSFSQLQRLAQAARTTQAITFSMDLLHIVEWLHQFTRTYKMALIVKHLDQILVALDGQVSTTKINNDQKIWRARTAATASVWWLQHPNKPFEALTAAIISRQPRG